MKFMSNLEIEYWKSKNPRTQDDEPVNIFVAYKILDSQIEDAVAILQLAV